MDFNDEDGDNFSVVPETEEDRLIKKVKISAFAVTKKWIETITNKKFAFDDDFRKSLSDGILLCNLLNCLKPGSIKRINKISTAISGYDNIGKFLRVCEEDFGLSPVILFETSDLEDLSNKLDDMTVESDRRLQKVLICLFHLAKSVENHMTKEILDPKPFTVLLQSRDHNVMRRLKSLSLPSDSYNEKDISKLIHNQNPNYLASLAQETLKKSQLNQSNLHKSVDDEEWQETLENWKEKRRQVISSTALEESVDRNGDSQELLDLKEKARMMKLQRDQLKDQSILSVPQPNNQLANGDNNPIPDIDEETKAMIERVKQKKLVEENKRRFSLSPPLSAAFASDSELSTSTAADKHDEESISVYGKNGVEEEKVSSDIHESNISNHCKVEADITKAINPVKCHLVNVKLTRGSKQDNDQCWGMEIRKGETGTVVSKVKIGSCADICEVRKGDEIVRINSEDVTDKSSEYIRSLFDQSCFDTSSLDTLRLCLRRSFDEDDFFNSDQSDTNEDNVHIESTASKVPNNLYESEITYLNKTFEESVQENHREFRSTDDKVVLSNVINTCESSIKVQESQSAVECIIRDKEDTYFPLRSNLVSMHPNVLKASENIDFEKENDRKLSVQDKIAKIESKNIINSTRLSSSLNTPKKSDYNPKCSNTSPFVEQSTERLSSNSDNLISRQISSGNSSLSNLYHYWETEAPKSSSSINANTITKSAQLMQVPLSSVTGERDYNTNIEMEIAEQHLDTSNINLEETWRTVNSSGNSSTSDDVSGLNDHMERLHYSEGKSVVRRDDIGIVNSKDDISNVTDPPALSEGNIVTRPLFTPEDVNNAMYPAELNHISNTSTGVQADLSQKRKPTNYTTITTSVESKHKLTPSFPTSRMSDDDTCSFTISNNRIDQLDDCPSTTELRDSSSHNLHSIIPNQNDLSKDYTTVTAVTQVNKSHGKVVSCTAISTESNVNGVFRDVEKSMEIEISVTPQLFPIRNKTLLPNSQKDRRNETKHNDKCFFSDGNSFDDENTLLVTDLDEVTSPVKNVPQYQLDIGNLKEVSHPSISNSISNNIGRRPRVEVVNKHNDITTNNLPELYDNVPSSKDPLADNNDKSQSLRTTVTTDPSMSDIVSVPTLFKGGLKSENSLSQQQQQQVLPLKSKNTEPVMSSKKIKKGNSAESNHSGEFKRSLSSKELKFEEISSNKDEINGQQRLRFLDDPKHTSLLNNSKYSAPPFLQSKSNFCLPSNTNTKSHTKSYCIERPVKQVSFNQTLLDNKPEKQPNTLIKQTKTNMKCNYCASLVGLEDLMVIEELNLHFHLRCFVCNECKEPLGDGKSDTDVRIRRSKLHCLECYNKKSSKSKQRLGCTTTRTSQSLGNISQNKGGLGGGRPLYVNADQTNNYAATNIASDLYSHTSALSSNNNALGFLTPSLLHVSFADIF